MESELEILRHRVIFCETVDEAQKMALIRAIQEIAQAIGLSPVNATPHQIVDAVRALTITNNKFYVSVCPETEKVFICETGVDNNIAEIFARNNEETVGDNAELICNALNHITKEITN